MKKTIALLLSAVLALGLTACGQKAAPQPTSEALPDQTHPPVQKEEKSADSNILIAYFSAPEDVDTSGVDAVASASIVVSDGQKLGSTEYVAGLIQQTVGGEMFRIETVEDYPGDHDPLVDQAAEEQDTAARPELKTQVENFDQYETILLGFPNWWGDMPMALYSFLEQYDFGAKTIIPFITHGGSGASRTVDTISQLQPGALIRDNALVLSRNDVASSAEDVIAWAENLNLNVAQSSENGSIGTVATATPTPKAQQMLYLWDEGNAPAVTQYTENTGNYSDNPDFRPYITSFPVPEGTEIRGAVLICAGGAFQFRSDQYEGTPVAQELAELGYQSFVVDYRLQPYTQEEGALDLARAVRFVRAHAKEYGIEEKDIAVMGFSAGGILAGEMLLHYDGTVNGTALDSKYVPDALDAVSADAAADGMIYSFYGRLSVGSTDVDALRAGDLPPTFYCYGTRDPFYEQFLTNADAVEQAGVSVERLQLDGMPHGFGNQGGWIPAYGSWLATVFENN